MGFQVTAFERNPVIAAILLDGLQRGKLVEALTEPLSRLDLVMADAKEGLSKLVDRPDVVYIDGMFPVKRSKAALAKKPMRLARRLVGEDDDLPELLAIARRFALNRVVVKRPQSAEPLSTPVSSRLKTKLVTYDIYPPSEPK
jgi:16S rRNA (guanine1516-N2)-methyltransferase